MRSAWVAGVLCLVGIAAGCSSVETDDAADEHYAWGNVTVDIIAATSKGPHNLTLRVTGEPAPLVFPSRTPSSFHGARVEVRYTCGPLVPYEVALVASTLRDDDTQIPWLEAVFAPEGVSGTYIDPTWARCDLTAGTAALRIPRIPPLGTSRDAAVGSFSLECQDAVGGTKQLEGELEVTALTSILLC
jgi:hypothetical protein